MSELGPKETPGLQVCEGACYVVTLPRAVLTLTTVPRVHTSCASVTSMLVAACSTSDGVAVVAAWLAIAVRTPRLLMIAGEIHADVQINS